MRDEAVEVFGNGESLPEVNEGLLVWMEEQRIHKSYKLEHSCSFDNAKTHIAKSPSINLN
jgi:hypothetical protein